MHNIIDAGEDARIDLAIEGGRGFAADVSRSGNDGFAEAFDEVAAEVFVDESDPNRAVGADEVGGQADGAFIDDGSGLRHGLQKIENVWVGLTGVLEDIAWVGHQDDEAFGFGPLFQRIYFTDGFRVGGIAADAPDGIGRIQDEAAGSEDGEAMLDVRVGGHMI